MHNIHTYVTTHLRWVYLKDFWKTCSLISWKSNHSLLKTKTLILSCKWACFQQSTDFQSKICETHTHTHTTLNGVFPEHQYFPFPCFLWISQSSQFCLWANSCSPSTCLCVCKQPCCGYRPTTPAVNRTLKPFITAGISLFIFLFLQNYGNVTLKRAFVDVCLKTLCVSCRDKWSQLWPVASPRGGECIFDWQKIDFVA